MQCGNSVDTCSFHSGEGIRKSEGVLGDLT